MTVIVVDEGINIIYMRKDKEVCVGVCVHTHIFTHIYDVSSFVDNDEGHMLELILRAAAEPK